MSSLNNLFAMTCFKATVTQHIYDTVKIEGRIHHNIQTQIIDKEQNRNQ